MAQTLFPLLKNAPDKRYVLLAEGTHTIIMEKNRLKLFEAVQAFLDEQGRSLMSASAGCGHPCHIGLGS